MADEEEIPRLLNQFTDNFSSYNIKKFNICGDISDENELYKIYQK